MREQGGALRAAGIRLTPRQPEARKSAFAAASATTGAPLAAVAIVQSPTTGPTTMPVTPPQVLVLKKLTIRDASLGWTDQGVARPAEISAAMSGDIDGIVWGRPAGPTRVLWKLRVDGIADEVKVEGTADVAETSVNTNLQITGSGLRQGALGSYLPPGMSIELKDGRFALKVDAGVAMAAKGGLSGHLAVTGVDYRDGEKGLPLFAMDSAKVMVSRFDALGGVIAVDEISVIGANPCQEISRWGDSRAGNFAAPVVNNAASGPARAAGCGKPDRRADNAADDCADFRRGVRGAGDRQAKISAGDDQETRFERGASFVRR